MQWIGRPGRGVFGACLCFATCLAAAAPLCGGVVALEPDPRASGLSAADRVLVLLDRVRAAQAEIRSLTADFVQRRESELLLETEESRGRFAFQRPDRVLWEYETPDPMRVLVDGSRMLTWYQALDRAELVEVGRYSDRILQYMGAKSSIDVLQRYFEVSVAFPDDRQEPYRLELVPRGRRVEKRLAGMTIWLDPVLFVPVRLIYREADGDLTEYEFEDLDVNPEIPASRFELDLPEGVIVRRITVDGDGGAGR